jgi:hypothetical protein
MSLTNSVIIALSDSIFLFIFSRDKYIEAEIAKKTAAPQEDKRSEFEKMKAALFDVPEHLKVG